MSLKVAYLVNQYPKVSHSFIRREILALEQAGIPVLRFAIRACADELVDEADKQELDKTRLILSGGILGLGLGLLQVALSHPLAFLKTLGIALKIGLSSKQGVLHHLAYLAEACVLLRWLAEAKVTHLHAHFGTNSATVAMLCHAIGGPSYSFTVHGPEEFDNVQSIALPEKIKRAAFVVAISAFGKSQLYRWCENHDWSKIHVIHCGVDSSFLRQPPVPMPDHAQLVCVGRLCADKGQLLLIKAVQQLAAEGLRFKLVLVGDGDLRPELERLINQFNLKDQVEITGWANSEMVRQHILASRALVLPSFAEGLPVVIMEALALGRPVISTYIAGIPELVQPGVSGWLVPSGSIEDLTAALRSVLQLSSNTLQHMGLAGTQQVAQQHDISIEARKLAGLLRSYQQFQTQADFQIQTDEAVQPILYPDTPTTSGN